jgi:Cu/Ag efflux protein CusF
VGVRLPTDTGQNNASKAWDRTTSEIVMQTSLACSAIVFLAALPLAVSAQHDHGSMSPSVAMTNAPMSEGVVRKIDRKAGEITIAHGPLVNLGMPKMTMTFRMKDPALLDGIKEGVPVRFVAQNVKGELVVVTLQAAN